MNTEKMIPIDFSRNITPFVIGDVMSHAVVGSFTLKTDDQVNNFNNGKLLDGDYYIVSFADRPNTTGKQPVADDVVVDDNHTRTAKAGALLWYVSCGIQIKTWKPNHAAMLAKFKEQGANTMNEQEHKAKSHEVALMTNALDDNPDEQVPVLSEDWVIDHLTDKPTLEQQEKAGVEIGCCTNPKDFGIKPQDFGAIPDDKPVFTQEMAKHRQAAPIGSSVQTSTGEGVVVAHGVSYGRSQIVVQTNETMLSLDDSQYYPIDSRTDEERAVDDLIEIMQSDEHSYSEIIGLIKAGKIHGVKWIIE